ncbi:MAG: hypothetical protein Q7S10_03305 [bacterium]|nr:hypothetical protein [bacterium]
MNGVPRSEDTGCSSGLGDLADGPGTYNFSETAGTNTNLADYTINYDGDCDALGKVILAPDSDSDCIVNNTRRPPFLLSIPLPAPEIPIVTDPCLGVIGECDPITATASNTSSPPINPISTTTTVASILSSAFGGFVMRRLLGIIA